MISTRGRYALRLMTELAGQEPEIYTPLKDISKRQQISEKYMEIIIKELVKNKLIQGLRGKGGGYRLTRSPSGNSHDFFYGISLNELTQKTVSR